MKIAITTFICVIWTYTCKAQSEINAAFNKITNSTIQMTYSLGGLTKASSNSNYAIFPGILQPFEMTSTEICENYHNDKIASVYPNPFSNNCYIRQYQHDFNHYSVSNIDGAVVCEGILFSNKQQIDSKNWPAGIYILRIWNTKKPQIQSRTLKLFKR